MLANDLIGRYEGENDDGQEQYVLVEQFNNFDSYIYTWGVVGFPAQESSGRVLTEQGVKEKLNDLKQNGWIKVNPDDAPITEREFVDVTGLSNWLT